MVAKLVKTLSKRFLSVPDSPVRVQEQWTARLVTGENGVLAASVADKGSAGSV